MEATIPSPCSNADYEAAMAQALDQAISRWPALRTAAFGDLFLEDIRAYREAQCARIGWQVATPLFGRDTAALAREMMADGLRARICCVDTEQLDSRFAGREFDETLLRDLPPNVDPCGENGEFHTCVYAGPMLRESLHLREGGTVLRDGRFAYTDFELAQPANAAA
jgi:diphthamide synthase (EF-2-diphthine--ammonia ligase)